MRRFGLISCCALLCALLASCESNSFQRSVPAYPVHVEIDVERQFVDFVPENFGAYITVDKSGYYKNDQFILPVTVKDAWGYAGVVVFIAMNGYTAYDLGCPNCASRGLKSPCFVDGMYAVCPECGENYDLGCGYAIPTKGLIKESLRPLNIIPFGKKLTITQKQ
jgi:hypothetical protein